MRCLTGRPKNFRSLAPIYGLKPEDLGRTFAVSHGWRGGSTQYKITGISGWKSKYPIIAERSDGRKFRFPLDTVKIATQSLGGVNIVI